MSSEIITSNDLKKILASAFPARANTTITSITLPYTPPCNGLFLGMLRASAQGRAYKQYSNTEPSLWDFYQVAGGYSTFASFVQAGKEIAQTATSNISDAPYYFFIPLDGTSPLFGGSADAVVEQGTSGSWTYRKWNSGISEAWYNATVSPSMTTAYGGIYVSPSYSVTLPSGLFISPPAVQAELAMQGGVGGASVSSVTATGISGYFFNGNSYNASSKQLQFNIYAKGSWK